MRFSLRPLARKNWEGIVQARRKGLSTAANELPGRSVDFDAKGGGAFHLGYIRGQIGYRQSTRDGQDCLEFTWEGKDEMDRAHLRVAGQVPDLLKVPIPRPQN
jgi:hypothetical protein